MRARRKRQEKIGGLRRELSGRKALAAWRHEVRGVREREKRERSNKNNGEEEKSAADEDETVVSKDANSWLP